MSELDYLQRLPYKEAFTWERMIQDIVFKNKEWNSLAESTTKNSLSKNIQKLEKNNSN